MKTRNLIVTAAAILAIAPAAAFAGTSVGIGFHNTRINGQSLPAAHFSINHGFGKYNADAGVTLGSGNSMSYQREQVGFSRDYRFDGGRITPGIIAGYERAGFNGIGGLSAAYAGAKIGYDYPLTRDVALSASGEFGRDFETNAGAIDPTTVGGLFYGGAAAVDFKGFGPGILDVSYGYRHLPISQSAGLHLDTSGFGVGYKLDF